MDAGNERNTERVQVRQKSAKWGSHGWGTSREHHENFTMELRFEHSYIKCNALGTILRYGSPARSILLSVLSYDRVSTQKRINARLGPNYSRPVRQ
jgi:hypothetical protein